ncbi:hypothetical protein V1521DRAFT_353418, partial [Lipomyces starkeyi]
DREIRCIYIDEQTGTRSHWKTADSARQSSTTNMATHLRKHSIYGPGCTDETSSTKKKPSIATLFK